MEYSSIFTIFLHNSFWKIIIFEIFNISENNIIISVEIGQGTRVFCRNQKCTVMIKIVG
jgi:hypothetical protein